jgi:hypothetical protein
MNDDEFIQVYSRLSISQLSQLSRELVGKSGQKANNVFVKWFGQSLGSSEISDEEIAAFRRSITLRLTILRLNRITLTLYCTSILIPFTLLLIYTTYWLKFVCAAAIGCLAVLNYSMSIRYKFPPDVNPFGYNPGFAADSERDMFFQGATFIVLLAIPSTKISLIIAAVLLITVRKLVPWPR